MTQEQIEAKALEEYPVNTSVLTFDVDGNPVYHDANEDHRAAFIKGCQYAATPSAVSREDAWPTREQAKVKAYEIAGAEKLFDLPPVMLTHKVALRAALAMYDYLASLSPAQPGYSEQQVRDSVRLARASNPDGIGGYTTDEIIDTLNKQP